jgi:hypothetical protein
MAFEILFPKQYQVRFVRTIVGAWNLYLVDHPEQPRRTLAPDRFQEIFPQVSAKAKYGCGEIDYEMALRLFGDYIFREVA